MVPEVAEAETVQLPGPFIVITPVLALTEQILDEVTAEYEIDPSPEYESEGEAVAPN